METYINQGVVYIDPHPYFYTYLFGFYIYFTYICIMIDQKTEIPTPDSLIEFMVQQGTISPKLYAEYITSDMTKKELLKVMFDK